MDGYKYLTGKYYEYYIEFNSSETSGEATNFKSEVELFSEEFENVKGMIANWSGEGAIAMADNAINSILNKFETTKKNIDTALIPATEATDKLGQELELMKEAEDLLIQKEQELAVEQNKNIPKTITNENDENGIPISKTNPDYNQWQQRINNLQNEIEKQTELLEKIKANCDNYIELIENLESNIEEFTNYLGMTNSILGVDGENVDFSSMNLEERLNYLDSLLSNYNEVMAQLNELYKKTYGEGFSFSKQDFEKLNILFDCFNIYDKADISQKELVASYKNDYVIFNIEALNKLMTYCNDNDVFGKIERYANGQSWEESGLASLYEDELFEFNEKQFLKKMKKEYGIEDAKTYLKSNFSNFKTYYGNLTSSYQEYKELVTTMQTMEAKIAQINQAKKLLPFEYEMENPEFLNYLNKNYTTYALLDEDKLQYMSQQEVALYDYLYNTKSPQEAANYLKAMEDAINQRIGAYKAAEYVEWIAQDGFQVTDLAASGFEGFKDGVRNWWDGIIDLGRVSSTEAGTKSALDYELMYKSMFMLDASEGYSKNLPEDMRKLINQFYQTGSSVGNMAVPMLAGFVPVIGKPLSSALMGLSIAGNSAVEAKQSGATTSQAYLYGAASGISEATTERLLGGIPGVSNLGKSFLGNMASEGLEEFTQTYMDAGLRNIILGENNDLGSKDLFLEALESGKQGAITSGILQGGNTGIGTVLNTTTSTLTGGKITNYGMFKNTVEKNFYVPKAENVIKTSIETLESGKNLSIGDTIKLSRAVNNVSAQELSSITKNLTVEQQSGLQNALKSNLGIAANKSIGKFDTANTFMKAETTGNIQGIDDLGTKLREDFTRDGKSLGEYLVEMKPETITQDVITQVKNETGNLNIFKTINNKMTANELSSGIKNVESNYQNVQQQINSEEGHIEELSSGHVTTTTNNTITQTPATNTQIQSTMQTSTHLNTRLEQTIQSQTTTNPITTQTHHESIVTPQITQAQSQQIANVQTQETILHTPTIQEPVIDTKKVTTAGATLGTLGLTGLAFGNMATNANAMESTETNSSIKSQTRTVQSIDQTPSNANNSKSIMKTTNETEARVSREFSENEIRELANFELSPNTGHTRTSSSQTTTLAKITEFVQNNRGKGNFLSSLFKNNSRNQITIQQQEIINKINSIIRNGQTCNYSVATTAELSLAMLSKITDLNKVTFTIDGGFRDINGNFKEKYQSDKYKRRTTYTGLETQAIIGKIENLQSRINMELPELERARQIYEIVAKEYKYMIDFENYKDGHMIAASLRGITSQNTTGKPGLVCAGYAQLYKELCNRAKITCEYIRGQGIQGGTSGPHAWNVLLIDGKQIPVDVTWKASDIEDWFGKSNKFAKSHIADSDEIYRNYAPEMENISNVINLLDAKYGTGRGINRLISYITTDNINEITKENGIRNIIRSIGKSELQNSLVRYIIPEQSVNQIENAVNTILKKYSQQESSLILQEYLKSGRTDIITSTNGARTVFTTIPSTQISTYIQIMHPEIFMQTNSSNIMQSFQFVAINTNQASSNVQQIIYTPNEIQVIKDIEYAIEQMQTKYGYSRAEILERVNKVVQTNNWLQITSQGNAREILQQHTLQELKAAYNTLISIENVPQNIEDYVRYATSKYMERYNTTIEYAIKKVQEVINNQDFMYMTSFGNARDVLMRCSFGEMQQALNKISLQSQINGTINSIDISKVTRTTSEFFEQTGNPTQGNYGVNQGALYRLFKFIDHNGRTLSYREAKDIVNEYKKTNRPLPKFKKVGTDEYFDLKDEIMMKYGFNKVEASILFTCIDDAGACSYASVCNEIFNYFKGNSTLFERTFGFPMYKTINNERVLNSEKLLIDLYIFANSKENRGRFIFKDELGDYHIDASQLTSTVDPLGRRLLDSEEQVYMSSSDGKNVYLINKYLKTKGLRYNSNRIVEYRSNTNSQNMNSVINHVIDGMKNGKGYSLGIYASGRPINMIAPRGSNYRSTSTHTWNEGGGHSVFITGVNTEGFIVSSWGEKYTIPFQDLLKNNHWILTEGEISTVTVKVNPLEAFKKLKADTKTENSAQAETQITENTTAIVIDNSTKAKIKAKPNPVSELIKIKKGQVQITETTTSTTSELKTPAYVEELSNGITSEKSSFDVDQLIMDVYEKGWEAIDPEILNANCIAIVEEVITYCSEMQLPAILLNNSKVIDYLIDTGNSSFLSNCENVEYIVRQEERIASKIASGVESSSIGLLPAQLQSSPKIIDAYIESGNIKALRDCQNTEHIAQQKSKIIAKIKEKSNFVIGDLPNSMRADPEIIDAIIASGKITSLKGVTNKEYLNTKTDEIFNIIKQTGKITSLINLPQKLIDSKDFMKYIVELSADYESTRTRNIFKGIDTHVLEEVVVEKINNNEPFNSALLGYFLTTSTSVFESLVKKHDTTRLALISQSAISESNVDVIVSEIESETWVKSLSELPSNISTSSIVVEKLIQNRALKFLRNADEQVVIACREKLLSEIRNGLIIGENMNFLPSAIQSDLEIADALLANNDTSAMQYVDDSFLVSRIPQIVTAIENGATFTILKSMPNEIRGSSEIVKALIVKDNFRGIAGALDSAITEEIQKIAAEKINNLKHEIWLEDFIGDYQQLPQAFRESPIIVDAIINKYSYISGSFFVSRNNIEYILNGVSDSFINENIDMFINAKNNSPNMLINRNLSQESQIKLWNMLINLGTIFDYQNLNMIPDNLLPQLITKIVQKLEIAPYVLNFPNVKDSIKKMPEFKSFAASKYNVGQLLQDPILSEGLTEDMIMDSIDDENISIYKLPEHLRSSVKIINAIIETGQFSRLNGMKEETITSETISLIADTIRNTIGTQTTNIVDIVRREKINFNQYTFEGLPNTILKSPEVLQAVIDIDETNCISSFKKEAFTKENVELLFEKIDAKDLYYNLEFLKSIIDEEYFKTEKVVETILTMYNNGEFLMINFLPSNVLLNHYNDLIEGFPYESFFDNNQQYNKDFSKLPSILQKSKELVQNLIDRNFYNFEISFSTDFGGVISNIEYFANKIKTGTIVLTESSTICSTFAENTIVLNALLESENLSAIRKFSNNAYTQENIRLLAEKIKQGVNIDSLAYLPEEVRTNDAIVEAIILSKRYDLLIGYLSKNVIDAKLGLIARGLEISPDTLELKIDYLYSRNDELLSTLNLGMLHNNLSRINIKLLEKIVLYKDIQDLLIGLSNNPKQIEIFVKITDYLLENSSEIDINGMVYNLLTKGINNNEFVSLLNNIDLQSLTSEETENLIKVLQRKNNIYGISSNSDLTAENYKLKRNAYFESVNEKINNGTISISELKFALSEKFYDMDYETLEFIYQRYCFSLDRLNNITNPKERQVVEEIFEILKPIKQIYECTDIETLKSLYRNLNLITNSDISNGLSLDAEIRRAYATLYSDTLYTPKENDLSQNNLLNKVRYKGKDIKVYEISGDFSLQIHALGAYREWSRPADFKEDWLRPKIAFHGICTSYIRNDSISPAFVSHPVLGFASYEPSALLLSGNYDLFSDSSIAQYATSQATPYTFLPPSLMINQTRHNHNEMVLERLKNTSDENAYKRLPDYIVYFTENMNQDNFSESNRVWQETQQAAKDFDVPIVVVNREAFYSKEMKECKLLEEEFFRTASTDTLRTTMLKYINNSVGARFVSEDMKSSKEVFSPEVTRNFYNRVVELINEKINNRETTEAKVILDELIDILFKEELSYSVSHKSEKLKRTFTEDDIISLKTLRETLNSR